MEIRNFLFKTFFPKEWAVLNQFITQKAESELQRKLEEAKGKHVGELLQKELKQLSDRLYKAIGSTIKIDLTLGTRYEYEYELTDYYLTYDKWIKLYLKRKGENHLLTSKISSIDLCDNPMEGNLISSKVHITLDDHQTRLYIKWNKTIIVPEDNHKFQSHKKNHTYDKFDYYSCQYHLEKDKENFGGKTSEKYMKDKEGNEISLLNVEADYKDPSGDIFVYDSFGKTGYLHYNLYFKKDDNYNNVPDYVEIVDNVQGAKLDNEADYGNRALSTRRLGRGSASLDMLFTFASENGFSYLIGELSSTDETSEAEKTWRNNYYLHKGFEMQGRKIKKYL